MQFANAASMRYGAVMSTDERFICLDQLLKLRGVSDSGGQAKVMIQAGKVKVNGEVETRRGRKLRLGDKVDVEGQTIAVDEEVFSGGG